MTQNEIIEMAKQIGYNGPSVAIFTSKDLEAFAKLVAQHEREACARVCDEFPDVGYVDNKLTSDYHAHLIRQRGQA
jgi:predicted ATP-grasp superfamily ATP-dependent carboligase